MMHKLMARGFFTDPQKSPDYNAGYETGWKDCLKAKEEEMAREMARKSAQMLQQFKPWADLQDKLNKGEKK